MYTYQGHEWAAMAENIVRGSWCPTCNGQAKHLTLRDMQTTAAAYGGICLSTEYLGMRVDMYIYMYK